MSMDNWRQHGSCTQVGDDVFRLPPHGDHGMIRLLRRICQRCEVCPPCLHEALTAPRNPDGFWGGHTFRERAHLRRALLEVQVDATVKRLQAEGT